MNIQSSCMAVAVGIGATAGMDFWNLFLKRAFGISSLNYCFLGRWLQHMRRGVFSHPNIATAPEQRFECLLGWLAHYGIGVAFAVAFVLGVSEHWLAQPTLSPALSFGIVTVIFPFFLMQPALGLGVAASRTPHPGRARLKSFATHSIFGLGLYLSALGLKLLG